MIACVGGGSNAAGIFYPFINDKDVRLIGVEAAGCGIDTDKHAATLTLGVEGIFHGMRTYLLQSESGQVVEAHSISAGLDYPGVGPELSMLKESGRLTLSEATDAEAVDAFVYLSRIEGIIPALESAHAVAYIKREAKKYKKTDIVVVNLSGRGDKDVEHVYETFLK